MDIYASLESADACGGRFPGLPKVGRPKMVTMRANPYLWPHVPVSAGGGEMSMAVSAYVLIQTEVGRAATVAREVALIQGVIAAEDVTGPYDVIARAEAASVDELGRMVVSRLQLIEGITRTLTCPVVHLDG